MFAGSFLPTELGLGLGCCRTCYKSVNMDWKNTTWHFMVCFDFYVVLSPVDRYTPRLAAWSEIITLQILSTVSRQKYIYIIKWTLRYRTYASLPIDAYFICIGCLLVAFCDIRRRLHRLPAILSRLLCSCVFIITFYGANHCIYVFISSVNCQLICLSVCHYTVAILSVCTDCVATKLHHKLAVYNIYNIISFICVGYTI